MVLLKQPRYTLRLYWLTMLAIICLRISLDLMPCLWSNAGLQKTCCYIFCGILLYLAIQSYAFDDYRTRDIVPQNPLEKLFDLLVPSVFRVKRARPLLRHGSMLSNHTVTQFRNMYSQRSTCITSLPITTYTFAKWNYHFQR